MPNPFPLIAAPLGRIFVLVVGCAASAAGRAPVSAQMPGPGEVVDQVIPGTEASFSLAYVPAASFEVGSPMQEVGRGEDEGPQRSVSVDAFWIGVTEVTHDVFAIFRDRRLDTEVGPSPEEQFDADAVTRPSPPYEDPAHGMGGPGRPATGMTRLSALRFARWLSEKTGRLYRLPTEAEWERACRAGGGGPYGLGADTSGADEPSLRSLIGEHAWFADNSDGTLHVVGTRSPNALGIHDLIGNAAEWTMDPYVADFYAGLPADDPVSNPSPGFSTRGRGVVRGGAFDDDLPALRCADRFEESTRWKRRDPQIPKSRWWNTDSPHVGFRLVSPDREYTSEEIRAYWETLLGPA